MICLVLLILAVSQGWIHPLFLLMELVLWVPDVVFVALFVGLILGMVE